MPANIRVNPIGIVIFVILAGATGVYLFGFPWQWFKPAPKMSMKQLLAASIYLAQKGGVEVKIVRESAKDLQTEQKGETIEGAKDLKTLGDMKSHDAIVNGFRSVFPTLKVVSEEHSSVPVDPSKLDENIITFPQDIKDIQDEEIPVSELGVWIDPLDATHEYQEKDKELLKYVTVMVCVVRFDKPLIGVIYRPFVETDRTYWAWVGKAQSENLKAIKPIKGEPNKKTKFIVSRSHKGTVGNSIKQAFGADTDVEEAAGAGYKTLAVIKGEADAYVHTTLIKKWDICAGNAILNHMHGKMTTLRKADIMYSPYGETENKDGLLVTMGSKHDDFLDKLEPVFKKLKKKKEKTEGSDTNKDDGVNKTA